METGLVAMVDNVLTTDMGQVSILDLSSLSAVPDKLVMWLLLAHLYVLVGTAESYSACPSLFGGAPGRSMLVAGLLWDHGWLLHPLDPLSWLAGVGGVSEVAKPTGVAALKSALYTQSRSLLPCLCTAISHN